METHYISLVITETGRNNLNERPQMFNEIKVTFMNENELREYLIDRYGKIPTGRNKIYRDRVNDKNGKQIPNGFTHSFWNKDWSHNTPSYYQTDWIEFCKIKEQREYFNIH